MVDRSLLGLMVAASAVALGLAFYVQYGLGYAPCSLCLQARLPHLVVLVLGGAALAIRWHRLGLAVVALAMVAAFAISLRHVGVEAGWLALPDACRVPDVASGIDALRQAMLAQVRPGCDVEGPSVFGLTMAGWHVLAALVLAMLAALALSRSRLGR